MARTYTATRYAGDTGVPTTDVAVGDAGNDASCDAFSCRTLAVPVDFGINSTSARTTVTGVPWVKIRPRPLAQCTGRPNTVVAQSEDEDALADGVVAIVTNVVDGVSFDVVANAPDGSSGVFTIQLLGVGT